MNSQVLQGDCFTVVPTLAPESIDLIYADPPFFTQKSHSLRTRDRLTTFAFCDEWKSRQEYARFLHERMRGFRRVLKDTGTIFVHCDANASHTIRHLLDEVFGEDMFRSEIIWQYRRWSNSQRSPLPSHQTIFFYSKTENYTYNQFFENYSPSTNIDQILQRRERDRDGKAVYARDEAGEIIYNGGKQGVPISDVWDIPFLNPKARERVGYPTQKPILLLERIIGLVTNPGDSVLDPFCGSGTTLVAATLLGRKSIGIDTSADAINVTKDRLANPVKTSSELLRRGRNSYLQQEDNILHWLHGIDVVPVQRNRGIDAVLKAPPSRQPVLFRIQRPSESLLEAAISLHRAGAAKQPATLILIATNIANNGSLFETFPSGVIIVNSTATEIMSNVLNNRVRA